MARPATSRVGTADGCAVLGQAIAGLGGIGKIQTTIEFRTVRPFPRCEELGCLALRVDAEEWNEMIKMPLLLLADVRWKEPPEFRKDCLDPGARIGWPHHGVFLGMFLILVAVFHFVLFPADVVPTFVLAALFAAAAAYGQTLAARYQAFPAWLTEKQIGCMRCACRSYLILQPLTFEMDVGSITSARFKKKVNGDKELHFVEVEGHPEEPPLRIGLDSLKTMEKLILCFEERGVPYEKARQD